MSGRDLYSLEPSHLAPYKEELLRVSKGVVTPKDARKLLPATSAAYLQDPTSYIELDDVERAALEVLGAASPRDCPGVHPIPSLTRW